MAKSIEQSVGELMTAQKKTISVAESCTGGLVANLITNVPGSSVYFIGGVVVYSNQAKMDVLKIPEKIIQEEGVVSRSCAIAMAQNVRLRMHSDIGLGITGIAGPGGGSTEKPVGSCFICITDGEKNICKLFRFRGNRIEIKERAGETALKMAKEFLSGRM